MTDSTRKKIIKWFWIVVTFPVLLLVFMILLVWMFADIPSFKDLENPDNKLATQVIAEDGEILTTFHILRRDLPESCARRRGHGGRAFLQAFRN